MSAIWGVLAAALLAFGWLASMAPSAMGQSTSQLNGAVTDPSGAAVPGANITLMAVDTGLKRSATSNGEGLYQLVDVPPGNYQLEVVAKGFANYMVAKVVLVVNTPSTLNIKLQVTGVATQVTVEGQGEPLINKTDATLGNTLEENQISELPIADRNVVQLLSLQPGVAYLGTQVDAATDTRSGAVNGMRSDQSNVTLDDVGVNDQNNGFAFTSILNVPPDSVEEFRVTTADANADSGYSSGAQVALITKSGTNNFHGSAYEYNRNTLFSANDPFLKNSQGEAGEPNKAPELIRNVFGGTVGGPIKHDKVFFFLNYEGRRDAQGASILRTVPTASLRDGVIIYQCAPLLDNSGNVIQTSAQVCPGITVNGNTGSYTLTPNGNVGYYGLGPSQIKGMDPLNIGPSTAVETLLNQYPAQNANGGDGLDTLGYRFSSQAASSFNTYIARMDWHINGKETLFWRGETQNTKQPGARQFPGQTPATTVLDDSKGSTVGLTSVISSNLINDFHWGFIRQGGQNAGASQYPGVFLNDVTDLVPFTRSTIFFVPVNQLSDSLSWTRGNHTLQFGTDLFLIRNNRSSYSGSLSDVQVNIVYLDTGGIANTGSPLDPPIHGYPAVDSSFGPNYDSAIGMLMGILAEGDGHYNFNHSGQALAQGAPINRRYAINDYEFYGQDTWRITPRLTLTYGLRWVLEAPPYETNGLQVAPCVAASGGACTSQNLGDWFNSSAKLASQGMPAINAGEVSFVLGGPVNNGPGLWNWDRHDFSPRVAVAWAPDTGDGWVSKILGHRDQFSVRGGYSIMYDHFGIPIVNSFDQNGSFGLSSQVGDSAGAVTVGGPTAAPRFTCLIPAAGQPIGSCLPPACPQLTNPGCLFGPTPSGTFPVRPDPTAFAINWGLDQSLKTPYSHVFNITVSRQVTPNSSLQLSYVGSVAQRLPMQVDLAMPTDLKDPASGMTYFQAATMLSKEAAAGANINQVQPIPFFENLFPAWASVTQNQLQNQPNASNLDCATSSVPPVINYPAAPTATQAIYDMWNCFPHNETLALKDLDLPNQETHLNLPNSKLGPYAFYHNQFSSLFAWRNIGDSNYNGLQVTYNVHWRSNLQAQFNYTFSKSLDEASAAERIGPYEGTGGTGNDLNGGGIVINSYDPLSLYGLSDFNAKHQINANGVYRLPFGKGQAIGGNASGLLNALIGGWQLSGIFRWNTGFPITVDNGFQWATNWNIEGDAEPNGPPPVASNPRNVVVDGVGGPDIFANPPAALAAFRPEWPGESGVRNDVIGDGMFNIDTGVVKDWSFLENKQIEFSWQSFNLTNSVRYDVRGAQPSLSYSESEFGRYLSTLTTPRFMQFALRFSF